MNVGELAKSVKAWDGVGDPADAPWVDLDVIISAARELLDVANRMWWCEMRGFTNRQPSDCKPDKDDYSPCGWVRVVREDS